MDILGRLQQHTAHTPPSTTYIYDLVNQCNLCSTSSLAAILGYSPETIRSMGALEFASLIHPDDLDRVSTHFQRFSTLVAGEVIEIEYRMKRANGQWCWLRSQETLFVQANDGFPLQVLGIVQDITDQKNSPDFQDNLSSVFDQLTELVVITDRDGMITYVNPAFEQLTGFSRAEAVGKTPAILKSGEHSISFYRHLWNTLHQGQCFQATFVNRCKNGDRFYEAQTITPIKDERGTITHFLSIGKRVSDPTDSACADPQDLALSEVN